MRFILMKYENKTHMQPQTSHLYDSAPKSSLHKMAIKRQRFYKAEWEQNTKHNRCIFQKIVSNPLYLTGVFLVSFLQRPLLSKIISRA